MAETQKEDKSAALRILTSEFRVSHPHLFEPSAMEGSKLNYSIEMLFDKATTKISELQAPLKAAIIAKWGPNKADWPEGLQTPIKDGDKPKRNKKTNKMEVRPEHKGMWVVRAKSDAEYQPPYVVGRDPKVKLTSPSQFYAGCYARAALKANAYAHVSGTVGVSFILDGVQFIRDGEALGGKRPADQMFGVIPGDSGDMELGAGSFEESEESFI